MRSFVINLARRPDRMAEFMREASLLPADLRRYERFEAVDGKDRGWTGEAAGIFGCRWSHQELLGSVDETVAVFEDDAVFAPTLAREWPKLLAELPEDWELLLLGCELLFPLVEVTARLGRPAVGGWLRTHAYVTRTPQKLAKYLQHATDDHVDVMLSRAPVKTYAARHQLAVQPPMLGLLQQSDVYVPRKVTSYTPPLRFNQRDDGHGVSEKHARLNVAGFVPNQASSAQLARAPRVGDGFTNTYS